MTLTLPTPDAGDTARQRFSLELLLQEPVPGPEQLLASRNLLSDALSDVSPDQWRALQAMPIAIGADHLDIAIPSQWRDQEWQHLIDQLPDQHRTIRLHPAIEADLRRALGEDVILASRGMVQEGVLLSNALIRHKVLPDMALNMLAIGEETGEMDKMLSKVADFYEDEVGAMVKALTSMLEPAMIVVVGGIVGSILLAMYLPMFTVFDQIQ